jgi:hypothetical protein
MDFNKAASALLADARGLVLRKRGGEVLHCVHASDVPEGCGQGPHCANCVVRNSVVHSLCGENVYREKTRMELMVDGTVSQIDMLVTATPIAGLENRVLLILEDVSELNNLRTLIPMCAHCRRIRNDEQYWQSVEMYFRNHLGMDVSHGLCQECLKKHYPEHSEKILKNLGMS